MQIATLLVALVALVATVDAQGLISGGSGRSSYNSATDVTTQLALSTDVDAVKTALSGANFASGAKTAYDAKVKVVADLDRTGDPVFDAFKSTYGGVTFITQYFNKAQVSIELPAEVFSLLQLLRRSGWPPNEKKPVPLPTLTDEALNPEIYFRCVSTGHLSQTL